MQSVQRLCYIVAVCVCSRLSIYSSCFVTFTKPHAYVYIIGDPCVLVIIICRIQCTMSCLVLKTVLAFLVFQFGFHFAELLHQLKYNY